MSPLRSTFITLFIALLSIQVKAQVACPESRGGNLEVENLFVVVNKGSANQLPPSYVPDDLTLIPAAYLSPLASQKQKLRAETLEAFARMHAAAAKDGTQLFIRSGFRSFGEQCVTFASKVEKFTKKFKSREKGLRYARRISAEPGRSQHQLGTTMDIVFKELNYDFSIQDADKTPSFHWLAQHAQDFGFIISYPFADDDHEDYGYNAATGYFYEPWHWRYVGIATARAFKESGLLPDEFLKTLSP